ncbi:MAG TPA: zinc ribbon domain-containing protein [Syntrophales bacterium]|nr:zinc ribbon domain-containing protein [Syntrophales bacterium]
MPLYDYECEACGQVFEVFHKIDAPPADLACPQCDGKKVKKIVAPFRTQFWSNFLDSMERKISPHKFK